jgi:hypothetical protein
MKYKTVYAWSVIDEIALGKKVHVLDKKTQQVYLVNELNVSTALAMTESKEDGRFVFWYAEDESNAEL